MEEEIKYGDMVYLNGPLDGFYKDIKFKVVGIEQISTNDFIYILENTEDGTTLYGMYRGGFFRTHFSKIKPIILI